MRASLPWSPGHKIASDDVRWLTAHLHHVHGDNLTHPRPAPGRTHSPPRWLWQASSSGLTQSVATDVLRDAPTGYRALVELNFPRFGTALGLYSIFPVRAARVVAMPADESQPATVM